MVSKDATRLDCVQCTNSFAKVVIRLCRYLLPPFSTVFVLVFITLSLALVRTPDPAERTPTPNRTFGT